MHQLTLTVLEDEYSIHRLQAEAQVPGDVLKCDFYSIAQTGDELSIVCPSSINVESEKTDVGWRCIKVLGILDLTLTGILAELTTALAEVKVSVFAFSTYDTDYLMVKSENLTLARAALEKAGCTFI